MKAFTVLSLSRIIIKITRYKNEKEISAFAFRSFVDFLGT